MSQIEQEEQSEVFAPCNESDSDGETETIASEKSFAPQPRPKAHLLSASVDISTLSVILHESPLVLPHIHHSNPKHSYQGICNK